MSVNDLAVAGLASVNYQKPLRIMLTGGALNGETTAPSARVWDSLRVGAAVDLYDRDDRTPHWYKMLLWKERNMFRQEAAVFLYVPQPYSLNQAIAAAQMLGTWRAHDWRGVDKS